MVDQDILHKLPKTDLHVHLDGSLRIPTILELADEQKIKLPAADEKGLEKVLRASVECESLEDYLKAFDITLSVLQTPEALVRAAYELAEDAAKENTWYMEVRYSPILHTQKGLKLRRVTYIFDEISSFWASFWLYIN